MFVTVEGIEASGKSTLIASLAARFDSQSPGVVVTREPGGTPLGDRVRSLFLDPALEIDPLAETFLLNASRTHLVQQIVRPALAAGSHVLCDRYTDATIAYQGYGRGLNLERIIGLCNAATGGLMPDRTLLLDLPIEQAMRRLQSRAVGRADRIEREDAAFHQRVRDGYLMLARGNARFIVLDASLDPAALAERAWQLLGPARGAAS